MSEDIVSQEAVDLLSTLGLNSYERKLYVTLLSEGAATAGTLSENSGVPRSRTYDVLESLADKGFVIPQNSKPLKYVAVEPEEALERAKNKHKEEYEAAVQRLDRAKSTEAMDELTELFEKGVESVPEAELTGSLKGRHAMHQQLETMLKKANSHICILTSEKGLEEIAANHTQLLQDASDRGVDLRIAAPLNANDDTTVNSLSPIADVRDIRHIDGAPQGRLLIADGKEALVALTHDGEIHPTQDTHIWTQSGHASGQLFQPLFDNIWDDARSLN